MEKTLLNYDANLYEMLHSSGFLSTTKYTLDFWKSKYKKKSKDVCHEI